MHSHAAQLSGAQHALAESRDGRPVSTQPGAVLAVTRRGTGKVWHARRPKPARAFAQWLIREERRQGESRAVGAQSPVASAPTRYTMRPFLKIETAQTEIFSLPNMTIRYRPGEPEWTSLNMGVPAISDLPSVTKICRMCETRMDESQYGHSCRISLNPMPSALLKRRRTIVCMSDTASSFLPFGKAALSWQWPSEGYHCSRRPLCFDM
eukprot:6209288-Pleurochrysis_carterae.AAC.1